MATSRGDWRSPGLHLATWLFGIGFGTLLTIPLLALTALAEMTVPGVSALLDWLFPSGTGAIAMVVTLAISWCAGLLMTYAIVALMLR